MEQINQMFSCSWLFGEKYIMMKLMVCASDVINNFLCDVKEYGTILFTKWNCSSEVSNKIGFKWIYEKRYLQETFMFISNLCHTTNYKPEHKLFSLFWPLNK